MRRLFLLLMLFGMVWGYTERNLTDYAVNSVSWESCGRVIMDQGDVNGDGVPDLVVCQEDCKDSIGQLLVFFGGLDDTEGLDDYDLRITNAEGPDFFYMSSGFCEDLLIDDLTGDGKDDILVAQPGPGSPDGAVIYVIYDLSMDEGCGCTGNTCPIEKNGVKCFGEYKIVGPHSVPNSIISGAGDVDGDGYNDLMIGVWYYPDIHHTNEVLVFRGPITRDMDFSEFSTGYYLNTSYNSGDLLPPRSSVYVNPDTGVRQLILGYPYYNESGGYRQGVVYYLGNVRDDHELHELDHHYLVYWTGGSDDLYGYHLSVLNMNTVITGIPGRDSVHVIRGSDSTVFTLDRDEGIGTSVSYDPEGDGRDGLWMYMIDSHNNQMVIGKLRFELGESPIGLVLDGEPGYNLNQVLVFPGGRDVYVLGECGTSGNLKVKLYKLRFNDCDVNQKPYEFFDSPDNLEAYGGWSHTDTLAPGEPVVCNVTVDDPDPGDVLRFNLWVCKNNVVTCSLSSAYNSTEITCIVGVNCSGIEWVGVPSGGVIGDQFVCKGCCVSDECQNIAWGTRTSNIVKVGSGPSCVNLSEVFLSSSSYRDVFGRYEFNGSTGVIRFIDDSVLCRGYYNMSVGGYPGKIVVEGVHLDLNGSVLDFGSGAEVGASLLGPGEGSYLRLDSGEVSDGSLLMLSGNSNRGMLWVNRSGVLHDLEMNVSGEGVLGHKVSLNMYNVVGTVIGSDMGYGHNLVFLEGLTYQDVSFRNVSVRFVRGVKGWHSGFRIHDVYNSNVSFSDVIILGSGYHGNTPTDSYPEFGISCGDVRDSYVELSDVLGVNLSGYGVQVTGSWDSRYNLSNVMFIGSGYNSASSGDRPLGYGISIGGWGGSGNEYYLSNVSVCWSGIADIGLGGNSTPIISSGVMCDLSNPSICEKGCGCLSSSLSDVLSSDLLSLSSGLGLDLSSVSPPDWWYVSPAHDKLLGSGGLVNWIPGVGERSSPSSSPSDTYVISSPGVYKLCSDRYTNWTNIIINSSDVLLDCGGREVGVKTSSIPSYISSVQVNDHDNITITNCTLVGLPYRSFPLIYGNAYSLYVNGSSDDVSIISSELGYDVKLENSGDVKFEDVEFTSPSGRDSKITFNSFGDVEVSDSRFDVGEIDLYSGDVRFRDVDLNVSDNIDIYFNESPTIEFIDSHFYNPFGHWKHLILVYGYGICSPLNVFYLENKSSISTPSSVRYSVSSPRGSIYFENFQLSHPEFNPFVFYVNDCNLTITNSSLYYVELKGDSFSFVNSSYIEKTFLKDTSKLNSVNSKFCNVSLGRGNDLFLTGTYQINNIYNITPDYNFTVGRLDYNYDPISDRPITCGVVLFDNGSMCKLTPGHYGWFYFVYNYKNPVDYRIDPLSSDPDLDDSGCNSLLTLNGYSGLPDCPEVTPEILSLYNLDNPCPFEYHLSGEPYKCREHIDYWRGWFEKYGLELPRELSSSSSSPT